MKNENPRMDLTRLDLTRRSLLKAGAGVAAGFATGAVSAPALAQQFPSKAIELIVPFAPGGPSDITSRIVGERITADWKQPVLILNKPGAVGLTGLAAAARTAPDGYNIVIAGTDNITVMQTVKKSMPVHMFDDFTYLGSVCETTLVLSVGAKSPYKTAAELFKYGKDNPGKLKFGTIGIGSAGHVLAEALMAAEGVKLVTVPYNGTAANAQALAGGFIDFTISAAAGSKPYVESGDVRVLVTLDQKRSWIFPDVLTLKEQGLVDPGVTALQIGFLGPKGVPQDIVDKYSEELKVVTADPKVQEKLKAAGFAPRYMSAKEFREFELKDLDFWKKAAGLSNISVP